MASGIARLIGRTLRRVRAGEQQILSNAPLIQDVPARIRLHSLGFQAFGPMSTRHAGSGIGPNLSPPLDWSGVPSAARELVIVMEDADAPLPRPALHLAIAGMPPDWTAVPEGGLNGDAAPQLTFGRGSFGRSGYQGPRPVTGHGPHRYIFQIIATDLPLRLAAGFSLSALRRALHGRVVARGLLTGVYERE